MLYDKSIYKQGGDKYFKKTNALQYQQGGEK